MDTSAYLHRHGWLGAGHALDAHAHGRGFGLNKPLLVSQKQNVLGLGKKKHDSHADQWWARAFDSSLRELNVTKSGTVGEGKGADKGVEKREKEVGQGDVEVEVKAGASGGALDMVRRGEARWVGRGGGKGAGGLYGSFVKGEGLTGTFLREPQEEVEEVEDGVVGECVFEREVMWVEGRAEGKRKRVKVEGDEERAERKRRRKEQKLRGAAVPGVITKHGISIVESHAKLLEEFSKRDGKDAPSVTSTSVSVVGTTQEESSHVSPRKKRRRVEVSGGDVSLKPVVPEGHTFLDTSAHEAVALNLKKKESTMKEDGLLTEKLERKRRRAARKALKAEQERLFVAVPGLEAETTKACKKKKRKHREEQS